MKVLYDSDVDKKYLCDKFISIVGYGSQARAHALNLDGSGLNVVLGLRPGSKSEARVIADGLSVTSIEDAVKRADIVMLLIPDEEQPAVYLRQVADYLKPGAYLGFAHGFGIHYGTIVPPKSANVFMVAPKAPGPLVRSEYEAGRGVPCLVATHQNPSGDTREIALAYARAIGGGRAGILETTFREETETDLFGEQAVLCGGLTSLVRIGFETLVEAGYAPEVAYFECLHELKLIVDLIYEWGIEGMRDRISNTARFGDYTRGTRVVGESSRKAMAEVLTEIQDGSFAREWVREHVAGKSRFHAFKGAAADHAIEKAGANLRSLMPWLSNHSCVETAQDEPELRFRVC
jgi:ketol-acid reductoisomerase